MMTVSSPSGFAQHISLFSSTTNYIDKARTSRSRRISSLLAASASAVSSPLEAFRRTSCRRVVQKGVRCGSGSGSGSGNWNYKKRVFFLDVNPLCYEGSKPSMRAFGQWVSLFFSQVSLSDPVIAVIDGDQGNQRRRELLPSYKQHRRSPGSGRSRVQAGRPHQSEDDVLRKCNVPVVRIAGHEADDVVATLVEQAVRKGHRAVIASPDKDFKQLISEDVQMVMPLTELGRWSFYTAKHYQAQYKCDPQSDLSIRCILGDEVDGVPGIQNLVPGFGRKTAMKLVRKHGSLEGLLNAAAVRTVGRPYVQEALTKYADYLRRNYEVLAMKRDVNVQIQEEWLVERDTSNDSEVLPNFLSSLHERYTQKQPMRL